MLDQQGRMVHGFHGLPGGASRLGWHCTRGWTWAFKEDAVTRDDFRRMALTLHAVQFSPMQYRCESVR
jgi:hypothetical protein